uniref:DUF663 domain-containing protein n=1 Tax=Strongyloides papillosus TaxID=174720 RepID=A0A0N5CIQ3_STREA
LKSKKKFTLFTKKIVAEAIKQHNKKKNVHLVRLCNVLNVKKIFKPREIFEVRFIGKWLQCPRMMGVVCGSELKAKISKTKKNGIKVENVWTIERSKSYLRRKCYKL